MQENIIIETSINQGKLTLYDLPLKNDTQVKVIIIPKTNLQRLSFQQTRTLLQDISGNLSDDIREEREKP